MEDITFPRGRAVVDNKATGDDVKKARSSSWNKKDTPPKKRSSDVLFGNKPSEKAKSEKSSKKSRKSSSLESSASKTSLLPLGGGGVIIRSKGDSWIEGLGFNKLAKGFKMLACVREVYEDLVIFSLPNLWTAYMLREGGAPCTDLLRVGQFLSVVIVKASQEPTREGFRRRIQVSCMPGSINPIGAIGLNSGENAIYVPGTTVRCQVYSVEDHGVLMDLGAGRRGFLSFSDIQRGYTIEGENSDDKDNRDTNSDQDTIRLVEGRIVDCLIKQSNARDASVLPLLLPSQRKMVEHMPPAMFTPTLAQLLPGTLVKAKVEKVVRNGICVSFCNNLFRGAVEVQHLGSFWLPESRRESEAWKKIFDQNRFITARIIAIDPVTKILRLSLQSHILELKVNANALPSVGCIIKNATVIRLDPGVGALLALPSSADDMVEAEQKFIFSPVCEDEDYLSATRVQAAYVHISKAFDKETKDEKTSTSVFAKVFAPSTKHSIRILSTSNWIDGIASGAAAQGVVDAQAVSYADLKPGMVFKQVPVCAQLDGGAVLVELGIGVRGLIPDLHLFDKAANSDFRRQLRKVKYATGAKVDVRVLKIDQPTKKCILTAKKSIVKTEHVITSFDEVRVGDIGTGFVSKVDEQGLAVTFFNGVYGRVTLHSLTTELGIDTPKESYVVGDVVDCKVVLIKTIQKRGRPLSDNPSEDSEDEQFQNEENMRHYREITLSLKLDDEDSKPIDGDKPRIVSSQYDKILPLRVGAILPAKSMTVKELIDGKTKHSQEYVPGYAIVSIKTKYLSNEVSETVVESCDCKLPFSQLLDEYKDEHIESSQSLDALARGMLTVGKKVNRKGFILSDPRKSVSEYQVGTGVLTVVSIKQRLVEVLEQQQTDVEQSSTFPLFPSTESRIFKGAKLIGYVAHIDQRYGSFVRFLNGLTGLIPKKIGGLLMPKYKTIVTEVLAVDVSKSPPKILIRPTSSLAHSSRRQQEEPLSDNGDVPINIGDVIPEATITKIDFHQIFVDMCDEKSRSMGHIKARLHCSMAESKSFDIRSKEDFDHKGRVITKFHPFYNWTVGQRLTNLRVLSVEKMGRGYRVELTNIHPTEDPELFYIKDTQQLKPGILVSGIVSKVSKTKGLSVEVSPVVTCLVPILEVSDDVKTLLSIRKRIPVGCRLDCITMDNAILVSTRERYFRRKKREQRDIVRTTSTPTLSLFVSTPASGVGKPQQGDVIVGRINRMLPQIRGPSLMLDLRGGFVGRCCITELKESDDWENMPLGRSPSTKASSEGKASTKSARSSGDESGSSPIKNEIHFDHGSYPHGHLVQCRVLRGFPSSPAIEVSLRSTRLEGDIDNDDAPEKDEKVQAFVVSTTKKGCFVRLSRNIEGRVILKELSDGFIRNPEDAFPPGRLVVGKVKSLHASEKDKNRNVFVDLDMRESVLLDETEKTSYRDIQVGTKYEGTITRIEEYGVFVRFANSDVTGLVHKSECSDNPIKNLFKLYDPGDLVKALVIKKDDEKKTVGLSLKASHFMDDSDSDDASDMDFNLDCDESSEEEANKIEEDDDSSVDLKFDFVGDDGKSGAMSESDYSPSEDDCEDPDSHALAMDTDVGFEWGDELKDSNHDEESKADDDSDDEQSAFSSEGDPVAHKSSHSSRRKQAQRRRDEQLITRREIELADGTADENPETSGDFERLLAGNPNSSELWMRYMAFHLSVADIAAARSVANRAFERIEFREEREKLNVWCALLTLELKYGSTETFDETLERACQHNNPKHVCLRACEILEKDSKAGSYERADNLYARICKRFKSKKKVWIAYIEFLLRNGRTEEAHTVSKRSVQSLPAYKHVETMSKFAQLVFEFDSCERARTIFNGLLARYPKRLDLFFVYVDKEIKHGEKATARKLFEKASNPLDETIQLKLSDKQMKSLFKKWFALEEIHGTDASRDAVKEAARRYVEHSLST